MGFLVLILVLMIIFLIITFLSFIADKKEEKKNKTEHAQKSEPIIEEKLKKDHIKTNEINIKEKKLEYKNENKLKENEILFTKLDNLEYSIKDIKHNNIKKMLEIREINELIHFTNIENLNSILENGFLSVELQLRKGIIGKINDKDRFDNKLNSTSFSIGFPNYKMFYTLWSKDKDSKWVIITIDPSILYLHKYNIYYCEHNAASKEISIKNSEGLTSILAFKNMFKETMSTRYYGTIYRKDINIPINYPTDPQAEILIEGYIPVKYIKNIYLNNNDDLDLAINIIGDRISDYNIEIFPKYFNARIDYQHWKRR